MDATWNFDLTLAAFDTVLEIREPCPDSTVLACDDDAGGNLTSFASVPRVAGQTVFISVDANAACGNFTLGIYPSTGDADTDADTDSDTDSDSDVDE